MKTNFSKQIYIYIRVFLRKRSVFMKFKFMVKQVSKLVCRWTIEETERFAKILAKPDNGFV